MREFFRGPIWISADIKKVWEPRLKVATALWETLERYAVAARLRPGALLNLSPADVVSLSSWANEHNLVVSCLGQSVIPAESYAAGGASHGNPSLRVALHDRSATDLWFKAWSESDNDMIGQLLGYPECCREFFTETWEKGKSKDNTLKMIGGYDGPVNILMRWLGVRLVAHLPCSSHCQGSLEIQEQHKALAESLGLVWQLKWATDILNWPVLYTTLHGILEVTTPALKFCASSDYVPKVVSIDREGYFDATPAVWEDNGFNSPEVMIGCHEIVKQVASDYLKEHPFSRIVDLGCGDGTLLGALPGPRYGVEIDAEKVARGQLRNPQVNFTISDVSAYEEKDGDFCLLMAGRAPEKKPANAVAYIYADWLRRPGGLEALCESLGYEIIGEVAKNEVAAACVVRLKEEANGTD